MNKDKMNKSNDLYNKLSQINKEQVDNYMNNISSNILKYKKPNIPQPKPTYPIVRPDEPFKDTNFNRDEPIEKIMNNSMGKFDSTSSNDNLLQAINYNTRPRDSSQLIESNNLSGIKIEDDMDISSVYGMMGSYITEKVSSDQLSRIQGKYNDNYSKFSGQDQTIYRSIDQVKKIDPFNPIIYY